MSEKLKDLRKLCIQDATSADEVYRNACERFANVVESHRPHRGTNKNVYFVCFNTERDAAKVMDGLRTIYGFRVDYANNKRPESFDSRPSDNRPYGTCTKCGKKAYYNCQRCDDFYCSVDCQRNDWYVHKLNCFPMPQLIPAKNWMIEKTMDNMNLNDLNVSKAALNQSNGQPEVVNVAAAATIATATPGPSGRNNQDTNMLHASSDNSVKQIMSFRRQTHSLLNGNDAASPSSSAIDNMERIPNGSDVYITYVRNHKTVFIRNDATNDTYTDLLNDTTEAASSASNLKSYPTPKKDVVLAPYDGIYWRALVISCNEYAHTVRVAFIDFGNAEEIPFDELKVLPVELAQRPRPAVIVQLKNVIDNPEPKKAEAMKAYLEEITEICAGIRLKVNGIGSQIERNDVVELIDMDANQSISDRLNRI